jgi:hypothetical protein
VVIAMHPPTRLRRNPRVVHRNLAEGQGAVLLHLDTGAYHGLNPVAALIWDLLEEDLDFSALVEQLSMRAAEAPATLDSETAAFLTDLCERDLVLFDPEPPDQDRPASTAS